MKLLKILAFMSFILATPTHAKTALLDQNFRPLAGKTPLNLQKTYGGQVLLVVNTASKCGFTPQYDGLEALHTKLKGRGFAVLGFPSNDFMGQEPGTEKDIKDFCRLTYGVKFPMFEKTSVIGEKASPFYKTLTASTGVAPGWNFHKYLIDRNGNVVASFGSRVKPDDAEMLGKIEVLLAQPKPKK
jgi:glutathione peroxidase